MIVRKLSTRFGSIQPPLSVCGIGGFSHARYTLIEPAHMPEDIESIELVNGQHADWRNGVYYGDASGGKYTKHPALRRVGVGLACYAQGVFHFGLYSNLPGPIQTVGRGEIFALLLLAQHLPEHAECEFVTDNFSV